MRVRVRDAAASVREDVDTVEAEDDNCGGGDDNGGDVDDDEDGEGVVVNVFVVVVAGWRSRAPGSIDREKLGAETRRSRC